MRYLYILFLIIFSLNVNAQKFGYAVKFGGGISTQHIKNQNIIDVNSITTLNVGGIVKYYFPHQWFIQSGINLSNKGAQIVEDAITTTPHISYLEIPLNLARKIKLSGLGQMYVGAGGYAAYAIKGHYDFETPSSSTSEKITFGNDKDVQRIDAGLNFTTGLEIENGLLFDIRYALGLANIATQPFKDTGTSPVNNRFLCVSIGYVFK